MFYLFKNSGKLKSRVKRIDVLHGITFYLLSKIHGTRFINHRRKGYSNPLHNLPALIASLENALANERASARETRAKIHGILKKLESNIFLCLGAVYVDVLENMATLSLISEKDFLLSMKCTLQSKMHC